MYTEVNDQGNLNLSLEQDKVKVDFEAKMDDVFTNMAGPNYQDLL